ncbi:GlxA family transcriptional regulator [Paraburkholderia caballeronis]|uniref:GlxA family transcriptional regulator n=1 Tax=Paraburkholderia caballeronis TaxID=416943 RepID=UPI001065A9FC|nr:helix-turn-helix domain-containing protein [Paraburkholderia caballeronis]TDV06276.1 AraC family transcriptional regulator with amidase-like domain [Paraburkholderia caballeronis]TDV09778.1 AraC family transcriptional regulator with amidase-like domain [Paraburkholderia caballeronis]TDV32962.1 AraC family transcriptional regulator with amidase-like domain [Paraburkholderia caballeronis]
MPVRHIVFAVAPDLVLLDACGPVEAFWRAELTMAAAAGPNAGPGPHAYRTTIASIDGGVLPTFAGLPIVTQRLDALDPESIDTLIVPGIPIDDATPLDARLTAWIADCAPRVRRVASVCTGAFYLAAAGLLDGRRAATHWRNAAQLARRFPKVHVDPEPIFICDERDGRAVWTSAGVTAGIDLSLALIDADCGHAVAMQAARRLVVFIKRPGGQSQFSEALAAQASAGGPFDALHGWMAANLHVDLSVERLAEQARMSPRTFARRYADEVGRTPARTVAAMRVEAAAHALAQSRLPLKRIASDCGFGSEQNLRRAFERRFGVLPLDYRARFSAA